MGLLDTFTLDDSAIAKLLAHMTGGASQPQGTMAGSDVPPAPPPNGGGPTPPAPSGPQMQVTPSAPPPPSLMGPVPDKPMPPIMQAPAPAPSGHRSMMDRLLGSSETPAEYKSLLNADEQKSIRPSLMDTLGGFVAGNGRQGVMRHNADDLLARKAVLGAYQDREAARKEAADEKAGVAAVRAEMPTYPDPKDYSATLSWNRQFYGKLLQKGLLKNAAQFAQYADMTPPKEPQARSINREDNVLGEDGKPYIVYSDADGKEIKRVRQYVKPDAPREDNSLVAVEGPDGQPVLVQKSQARGMKPWQSNVGAGSAINLAAKARLTAAISEMNNAHNGMRDFEAGLSNGSIKISAPAQTLARVANAFTHDDPLSQLTQSGTLAVLNRTDPALARYIRRGLSFAEGESMISQRPSDFRTKMAAFLSTAASGASPEMISDISGRRSSILTPLNETMGLKGAGGHGKPTLQERIAELKAAGKSKDESRAILKAEGLLP